MDLDTREKAYKFVAYSGITFSLVAVLSVCITFPMIYNYVNHVHGQTAEELTFCKVKYILGFDSCACLELERRREFILKTK